MGGGWDEVLARPPPAATPPPANAVGACATHEGRAAVGACTRCGTFVCAECARSTPSGELVCVPCEERTRDVVPWEDPKVFFVAGFFRTLFGIVARPHRFFWRLPSGTWWRPALFSMLGSFVFVIPMVIVLVFHKGTIFGEHARIEAPEILGGLVGLAIVGVGFAVAGVLGSALYALPVHGLARGASGSATFRDTLRACLYASTAFWPWPLLLVASKLLPEMVTGFVAILTFVAMPIAGSTGLAFHLAGRHGLRPITAWAIALGLAFASNLACCTALGVLGAMTGGA